MINIPKGTKDVLPAESHKWQFLEKTARDTAHLFGAREIRTPVFEHTELFTRSIGGETDVVSKEMYTFLDKGERSITLKPEGTAPVARSYVENSLENESLPLKMFYITPVFRYERPQAGRLREHHQFGVECYGSGSPFMDAEVINLAYTFLNKTGLSDVSLNLNSIGCPKCRAVYNEALRGFLAAHEGDMCETCKQRIVNNPLRTLDCKVEECKKIVALAPRIIDYICEDCTSHLDTLKGALETLKIPYKIDSGIVRGLDYYTKTVFEFVTHSLGAQGTICGGGRYDNMVESVGGKPTPCVGFGMGLERLIMLLEKNQVPFENNNIPTIYVAPQSAEFLADCIEIVNIVRRNGISAETDFLGRSVKSQLKYADKIKAKFAIVIGGNEKQSGEIELKDMSNSTSVKITTKDLVEYLEKKV